MALADIFRLLILAALWGASFLFMKVGAPEFGPIAFMALRTSVACAVLLPMLWLKGKPNTLLTQWRPMLTVALFNTAIPFVLFAYATLSLSAGMTSILNATTPMFGALIAFLWLKDTLSFQAMLGLIIGFIGVFLLVWSRNVSFTIDGLLPVMAVLLATFCYGLSANYTKRYFTGVDSWTMAAGSQTAATVCLIPFALMYLPNEMPSSNAWLAGLTLGVACTGFAYVIFFRLIANVGPTQAVSVTYLIPVFGVMWGMLFLDEQVTLKMLMAGLVILVGVALATGMFNRLYRQLKNHNIAE